MSFIRRFILQCALILILIYQRFISPFKRPSCRFYPSCSHYARESLRTHGLLQGSYLTLKRLLCCQPFCQGGFDPVPLKKAQSNKKPSRH